MANTLKVTAFIVLIVVAIAGFASMIPQLESPAPEAIEISGNLSGPELAAMGQRIFESAESSCTACHALGREGLRGPDLAGIGAAAAERVNGESAEDYLRKSIVEPCAHVIEGYDCVMPATLLQTLGEAKVIALIAFMQSLGGEVTVKYAGEQAVAGDQGSVSGDGLAGITAEEILTNAGCIGCHKIGDIGIPLGIGPDLSTMGALLNADEIRQSILDPDAVVSTDCAKNDESGNQVKAPGCSSGNISRRVRS
jgi:cytochrome c5